MTPDLLPTPEQAAVDFVGEHLSDCVPGGYIQRVEIVDALTALLRQRDRAVALAMRERYVEAVCALLGPIDAATVAAALQALPLE